MTLSEENAAPNSPPANGQTVRIFNSRGKLAIHIVSILLWLYATIKLFVFDVDIYLVHQISPTLTWVTQLRFVVLIGAIGVLFAFCKTQTAIFALLYILFYPLIIVFWKLPVFIFKQKSWTLAFALANSAISFFRNIKRSVISVAVFLTSATIILVSSNKYALGVSAILLLGLLTFNYIVRFISVFRRSYLVAVYTAILNAWRTTIEKTNKADAEIRNLPVTALSKDQLKIWSSSLETQVLFNRVCLFTARKLRNYQKSRLNIASGVFTTLALLAMTIFTFAIVNLAAYKIDPGLFAVLKEPTLFDFFHYSFKTFLVSSIKEIDAVRHLSEALSMIENFFSLFLGVIFASLIISVRSQRYSEDLDLAIKVVEVQGQLMERNIIKEFRIRTIDDAITELERAGAGMISLLVWLSKT